MKKKEKENFFFKIKPSKPSNSIQSGGGAALLHHHAVATITQPSKPSNHTTPTIPMH